MEGTEFVPVMAKSDRPGRPIVADGVKGKHHLAAVLRPMALLARIVFADVRVKTRFAVSDAGACPW
jgi:hypothetical protein